MVNVKPCLWFNQTAEEAVDFYISVFPDSTVGESSHYPEGSFQPAGTVLTIEFTLDGQELTALNAGPEFRFTEAISLQVFCKDQAEIDYYWNALTDGGEESVCGWLKDRFGLSWQVVPEGMNAFFNDNDSDRVARAWEAMMGMKKIDIAALEAAAAGS